MFLAYHQMAVRQGHEGREDEADEAGAKDVDREGEERRIQIDAAAEVKGRREEGRKGGRKVISKKKEESGSKQRDLHEERMK